MLVDAIHNNRPIVARTAFSILSSACARYRVIGEITVVVFEKRRDGSVEKPLDNVIVIDNSWSDGARRLVKNVFEDEAGNLRRRHDARLGAQRNKVAQSFINTQLDRTATVEACYVDEEISQRERSGTTEPIAW